MKNVERNNQSKHVLFTNLLGQSTIQEPKGWSNDVPSFERNKDSRAILSKTEINLEFYGDGAEWLEMAYKAFGVSEKVFLLKYEKDFLSINEKWKLRYNQQIDMGTYEKDEETGAVKVKATEGGLTEEIMNRKNDKYDLINTLSADGVDIGVLKTYDFQPTPRDLFFNSLLKDSQLDYRINSERYKNAYSNSVRTIPLKVVYNPNSAVFAPANSSSSYNTLTHDQDENGVDHTITPYVATGSVESIGDQIVWRSDVAREVDISLSLEFKVSSVYYRHASDKRMWVELRKSSLSGGNDVLQSINELLFLDNPHTNLNVLQTVNYSTTVQLAVDESFSIVFHTYADLGTASGLDGATGAMDVYLNVIKSELIVEDSTPYAITKSRCIKPFDLFERLVAKITGENGLFKSSIFDTGGEYEHIVVDNGFWVRGFPDSVTEDDGEVREIQFTTSFDEAFKSFNYLEPLTWFEEIDGGKSVIRIEKATYTMKNFVGIYLESVDKVQEKAKKNEFFSKITIGTKKSLEYEELNGLDETNGKSEFGTHIKYASNDYDITIDYRFDPVGYELARRKPYSTNPKEDTKFDDHIFMHDAKFSVNTYYHKLWADRFDSAPTGIYSPETAWNLWLSPMNRLFYGHGYSINRGLYHYPTKYVRFNSSNANKNLVTVYNGKSLQEGGNFQVSELEKPRIEPLEYEITFNMTQAIEDNIRATTKINGEEVPNYFGLIEFSQRGVKRYARLVKLQAEDEGKLTAISAKL